MVIFQTFFLQKCFVNNVFYYLRFSLLLQDNYNFYMLTFNEPLHLFDLVTFSLSLRSENKIPQIIQTFMNTMAKFGLILSVHLFISVCVWYYCDLHLSVSLALIVCDRGP